MNWPTIYVAIFGHIGEYSAYFNMLYDGPVVLIGDLHSLLKSELDQDTLIEQSAVA